RPEDAPCADSAIYNKSDRLLAVRTADCAPLLLASKNGKTVAAVHAGWRGIVAGVIQQTIKQLQENFAVRPDKIVGAIGPCIGSEHFQVGFEVAKEFEEAGLAQTISKS